MSPSFGLVIDPGTKNTISAWTTFESMLLDGGAVQASSPLPEMPMSPSFGLAMNPETTVVTPAWAIFDSMLLGASADQASTTDPAERAGILGDNEESATISHSRFPPSLEVPLGPPKQPSLCSASRDPSNVSGGNTLVTSTASNYNLPFTTNNSQSTLLYPLGITDSLERFSFHGTDPESIIPQLQLLRSQLFKYQDSRYLECHFRGSWFSMNQLAREITSDSLLSEVDDMLCCFYDVSARLIRQRRAGAGDRRGGSQNFSLTEYCHNGRISESDFEDVWRDRSAPQIRGKITGLLAERWRFTGGGKFQVQLIEASKKPTGNHGRQSPYSIIISFIPEVHGPTTGISVAFSRLSGSNQSPRMCPTITTVIPEDSAIITCVKNNDLNGVQRLFDERKASARDVDPSGYSLLYVSQIALCKEVIWTNSDDSMLYLQDVQRCTVYFYGLVQVHSVAMRAKRP
jgi:hypothetical protein